MACTAIAARWVSEPAIICKVVKGHEMPNPWLAPCYKLT